MATHGRYTIVRKIADGGMAEIFLAVQRGAEGFEKRVVLKRILTAFYADPQFRNMFIDEAHISMSLSHSNIVQILDLGAANGRYFLVLELVNGWDLEHIMQRSANTGTVWPTGLGVFVVAEVCRALAYAHRKEINGKPLGIVHRDISPNNVFVSDEGEIKLADFGIAKAMGKREQTAAGVIKGKVAFMSPEQAMGHNVDPRSDLFSLGTVLYLMATGRRPFEGATDLEAMLRVQRGEYQPPEQANPALNRGLAAIINRSMQRDPAQRYQTADDMLVDLERVLRESFLSVGRSELKRWLAELQQKDNVAPLGQGAGAAIESDMEEGFNVILEDSSREISLPDVAGMAFREPSRRVDVSALTQLERIAATPTPPPQLRKGTGWHSFLLGSIFTLLAAGAVTTWGIPLARKQLARLGWTPVPASAPARTESGVRVPNSRASDRSAKASSEERAASRPPEKPARAFDEPAPASRPEPMAATVPDAQPPQPPAVASNTDDDEDALLQHAIKDADKAVIGEEDEAEPAAKAAKPRAGAKAKPVASTANVKLNSSPPGAIVKVGARVFGRTPIVLHFKSGAVYKVSFVKRGYVSTSKNVAVSAKKGQSVTVKLAVARKKIVKKRHSILSGR